jgi:hypothetical protein
MSEAIDKLKEAEDSAKDARIKHYDSIDANQTYKWIMQDMFKLVGEAIAILEKQPDVEERYKDYERLWVLADQDNCTGDCDLNPPHKKCPECRAGEAINDCGETRDYALRVIEQVLKGKSDD